MALLDDVLKAGPVPLVGLGVVALALPYFFPALRPQFEAVFKSGAKLFLEAELGADDAIADRFVDAAVGALFHATAHGTDLLPVTMSIRDFLARGETLLGSPNHFAPAG